MDAANLLKPMLARGELRCIGATTLAEYRQHMEKDAAFERRFQQVSGKASLLMTTRRCALLKLGDRRKPAGMHQQCPCQMAGYMPFLWQAK